MITLSRQRCLTALTVLFMLAAALSARAQDLVSPNDMGTGSLLLKAREPGRYVEAPRVATDFDITINGPVARTRVTQHFRNPAQGWVEGVYVFPLPENAAVDTLKMVVGERVIIGDIKEKQEAKQIYEDAKARGEKVALLEQERPNLFTNQIANIGPNETVVIQIEYQQPIRVSGGISYLRVPLVVAPRYNPAPEIAVSQETGRVLVSDSVPDRARIEPPVLDPRKNAPVNPVSVAVHLNAGFALGTVKSQYHDVWAKPVSDQHQEITLLQGAHADRDFELTWTAKAGAEPDVGLFNEHSGDGEYSLLTLSPPAVTGTEPRLPREAIFVIDNSGSMGGPSMNQAKASLQYALDRLDPADKFNVIRFDDTMDTVFADAVEASPENINYAKTFVGRLEATGGTEMIPPLRAALRDARPDAKDRLRQVVFLTDGAIGNEQEMFDVLSAMRGRSRVFMVGIGSAPNSYLMTRAAELGRGSFTQIGEGGQVEERMRELFAKLENPVATDMKAEIAGAGAEMTPAIMPDLYRGEPLTLLIKSRDMKGTLALSGKIAGQEWRRTIDLASAETGSGIAKLWARRKIDDAEVQQSLGTLTPEAADKRILALALDHHLVSRVTSLVATDKTPSRPEGEKLARADVPLNLPAGWDYDKVFGEQAPAAGERDAKLDVTLIAMSTTKPTAAQQQAARTLDLPEGGTLSDLLMILGLLASLLALLLALLARRPRTA
ncbi:marine proteobacterial sortase target protein [soil metagenome]